jgi:hypothetical protein
LKNISDQSILDHPNFFKIIGRSHLERWHSSFWGWLIDPLGTHNLKTYVLKRILFSLLDERTFKPDNHNNNFFVDILPTLEFHNSFDLSPNESDSSEKSIPNIGRFDIFFSGKILIDEKMTQNINILFEMKIDSPTQKDQSIKYANWLLKEYPKSLNFLIYILPPEKILSSSLSTVGDSRWYCIDFQTLNDKVLVPVLRHPEISDKVIFFIKQYINNLRIPYKGKKMALTEEEKKLAKSIYDRYEEVFINIFEILQATDTGDFDGYDFSRSSRGSGKIVVKIEDNLFEGNGLPELYRNVLKFIVDSNFIEKIVVPWGTGRSRYIITNEDEPTHPNGRKFFSPVQYKEYTLESHADRDRGVKILSDLCEKLEISFERIEG